MRAPSAAAVIHARPCSHVVLVLHACIRLPRQNSRGIRWTRYVLAISSLWVPGSECSKSGREARVNRATASPTSWFTPLGDPTTSYLRRKVSGVSGSVPAHSRRCPDFGRRAHQAQAKRMVGGVGNLSCRSASHRRAAHKASSLLRSSASEPRCCNCMALRSQFAARRQMRMRRPAPRSCTCQCRA